MSELCVGRSWSRSVAPVALLVVLAGGIGGVAGCDSRSSESKTITQAASQTQAAGTVSDSATTLATTMKAQGAAVQDAMSKGAPGEQAAAALISAQALHAQAEADAHAAMLSDQEIRRTLGRVSELSSLWTLKTAVASTAEQFDPTPQITQLGKDSQEKDSELAQLSGQRDTFASQIQDLDARAAQASQGAKELLDQASALQQRASAGTAREGVPLVEQAAKLRREGDRLRLQGDTLTAQADQLRPQLAEVEAIIAQLTNQKAKLKVAQDALRTRQASAQQEARQSRELAADLEKKLDDTLAAIFTTRDTQFQPAFDKAKNGFTKAAGDARKATGDAGKLAAGSAQLSLSTLLNGRAELLGSMAGTMKVLVDATPALPKKSEYEARYNTLLEERKGVVDEAKAALEAAQSAFGGVSARDPQVRERLDKLKQLLSGGSSGTTGGAGVTEGAAAPTDAAPATSETASSAGSAATPVDGAKQAFAAINEASKTCDTSIFDRAYRSTTPEGAQMIELSRNSMPINCKINKACQEKFGMSAMDVLAKNAMMGPQMQAAKAMDPEHWTPDSATFTEISPTTVTASLPGLPTPLNFELDGGAWKLNVDSLGAMMAAPGAAEAAKVATEVMGTWGDKIIAGEYADAQTAADAFGPMMMGAMQQLMGQPGGRGRQPGGGGG